MILIIPDIAPGTNKLERMHWAKKRKLMFNWFWMIKAAQGREPTFCFNETTPVTVKICRVYKRNPMDYDNLQASAKIPLDALKQAGWIKDDNPNVVTELKVTQNKADSGDGAHTIILLEPCLQPPQSATESKKQSADFTSQK